jgi:DNA-binding Lrp family transcriptional regulator
MYQPDVLDSEILKMLQEDAKYTNKEIAAALGLTTTPVFERIKRLEKEGFILRYVALCDASKLGFQLTSFCNVSLKEHAKEFLIRFEKDVQSLDEVMECYHIAGMYDYLLKVVVRDMQTYQNFVAKKLAALENIGRVQSSFVMTELKHATHLPV